MTAIERTVYPRLITKPSTKELEENYTPTSEELTFVTGRDADPHQV